MNLKQFTKEDPTYCIVTVIAYDSVKFYGLTDSIYYDCDLYNQPEWFENEQDYLDRLNELGVTIEEEVQDANN